MGKGTEVNRDRDRNGQRVRKRWTYEQNNREGLRMRKIVRVNKRERYERERETTERGRSNVERMIESGKQTDR